MLLSIIIINWNSRDYVRQCLTSLFKYCPKTDMEVIVVDGASFDGCGEMLAREFPEVVFVQSEKNIGFARANNLGAKKAKGRNILFLNPDTELLEDSISVLCSRLDSLPGAGAVGCKLLNSDRTLQTSCIQSFPTVLNQVLDSDFLRARFPRSSLWGTAPFLSTNAQPEKVEAISGACLLVKRTVFQQVGGFSGDYFMFGEDLDLCYKIRKAGYHAYYVPETSLVHYGGSSTQKAGSQFSNVMMRESVCRFMRLNRGCIAAACYRTAMAANSVLRLVFIFPLLLTSKNNVVRHGTGSLRKWLSILRWSLGLETRISRAEERVSVNAPPFTDNQTDKAQVTFLPLLGGEGPGEGEPVRSSRKVKN